MNISQQLRQARLAAREDLAALAKRTGVRQENLRAIEEERFGDLPRGIYGRAAVRSFATAFGFDGAAVLAECEPLLTPIDEPIAALARVRGGGGRPADASRRHDGDLRDDRLNDSPRAECRRLAAAAVDGAVIGVLLLVLVVAALTLLIVPVAALREGGGAFAIMGLLLAGGYFLCFGGVGGATVGERVMAVELQPPAESPVTLRLVAERALLAATADARCIARLGERLGRTTTTWIASTASEAKG